MRTRSRGETLGLLGLAIALGAEGLASAAPAWTTYTGELRASNGLLYEGPVDVIASLYDSEMGGAPLLDVDLGEVEVIGGVLQVDLASAALSGLLFSHDDIWLEFSIDDETLSPRQKISSVPFALVAGNAQSLGGSPPSAFLKVADPIASSALPTAGLAQVSNSALSTSFANITRAWSGSPIDIGDAPAPGATASFNALETGNSYLTSLTVYTQFSLTDNSYLTMVLTPPAGAGVGAITLVSDASLTLNGPHTKAWTPGTTPALGALLGKKVSGTWTLTITDTTDDKLGTLSVGKLEAFSISYDVVRSDHVAVNGRLDVQGDLNVSGKLTVTGIADVTNRLAPVCLYGNAQGNGPGGTFDITWNSTARQVAGLCELQPDLNKVKLLRPGWYRVQIAILVANASAATVYRLYGQKNGSTILDMDRFGRYDTPGGGSGDAYHSIHNSITVSSNGSDSVGFAMGNDNSSAFSLYGGASYDQLTIEYLGQ